jgi:hypothetical protein
MSNLLLSRKLVHHSLLENGLDQPQNQWSALISAHQEVGQNPENQILVRLYDSARTFFIKSS